MARGKRVSYTIDYQDGGFIIALKGNITLDELNLANGDIHGHQYFDAHHFQIVNLLDASLVSMSQEDILIPTAIDYVASKTRKNVKMAIVAQQPHSLQLAEYFIKSARDMNIPWKIKIFPELQAALLWAKK